MIKITRGFVLFTTMVLLLIVSMLLISLLQALAIDIRASSQMVQQHKKCHELEALAKISRDKLARYQSCIISGSLPISTLIARLKQHQACEIQTSTGSAWLLLQDLGVFPCLTVQQHNQFFSSHHWLVTVAQIGEVVDVHQWRRTYIAPFEQCFGSKTSIPLGNISWRHLRV